MTARANVKTFFIFKNFTNITKNRHPRKPAPRSFPRHAHAIPHPPAAQFTVNRRTTFLSMSFSGHRPKHKVLRMRRLHFRENDIPQAYYHFPAAQLAVNQCTTSRSMSFSEHRPKHKALRMRRLRSTETIFRRHTVTSPAAQFAVNQRTTSRSMSFSGHRPRRKALRMKRLRFRGKHNPRGHTPLPRSSIRSESAHYVSVYVLFGT